MNAEFKQQLKKFIQEHSTSYCNLFRNNTDQKYNYYIEKISELTPKLSDNKYSYSTRCYWILNDLIDFPKCQYCGKSFGEGKNVVLNRGYGKTCCKKCKDIVNKFVKSDKKR